MAKRESSHEGHKMGHAVKHLHKMHKEHGHPDHHRSHGIGKAVHSRVENENREDRGFERTAERDEREDD